MAIGEKLWEEKGKAIGVSIKSIGPDGVTMEGTYASKVESLSRFPSVGTCLQEPHLGDQAASA